MEIRKPTEEEVRWMRRARRLLRERPASLWLYLNADGGDLCAGPEIPREVLDLKVGGIGRVIDMQAALQLSGGNFGPIGPGDRIYLIT